MFVCVCECIHVCSYFYIYRYVYNIGLNRLPLAALVVNPIALHTALLNDLEVADCIDGHTFLSSCDLFSRHKKTA